MRPVSVNNSLRAHAFGASSVFFTLSAGYKRQANISIDRASAANGEALSNMR